MSRYENRPAMFARSHNQAYYTRPQKHTVPMNGSRPGMFVGEDFEDIELGLARPVRAVTRHTGQGPDDGYPVASPTSSEPWLRPAVGQWKAFFGCIRKHPLITIFALACLIAVFVGIHFAIT